MTAFLFWCLALWVLHLAWSSGDLCPKFQLWLRGVLGLGRCAPDGIESVPPGWWTRWATPRRKGEQDRTNGA
jgi:hypothetical protein